MGMNEILFLVGLVVGLLVILSVLGLAFWAIVRAESRNQPTGGGRPAPGRTPGAEETSPQRDRPT